MIIDLLSIGGGRKLAKLLCGYASSEAQSLTTLQYSQAGRQDGLHANERVTNQSGGRVWTERQLGWHASVRVP
jgi:hypothetical protein